MPPLSSFIFSRGEKSQAEPAPGTLTSQQTRSWLKAFKPGSLPCARGGEGATKGLQRL